MMRVVCLLATIGALLPILAADVVAAEADEAAETFQSLYGADLKAAKATRSTGDDLQLSRRLLAHAKGLTGNSGLLAVLYQSAYELASGSSDGYETAIEAAERLESVSPEKAGACAEWIVAIRQKQFDAAKGAERRLAGEALIDAMLTIVDARVGSGVLPKAGAVCRKMLAVANAIKSDRAEGLKIRQKEVATAMRAAREAELLKKQLEGNPQNQATREKLVRLYLVDMDHPAEAVKYLAGVKDAALLKYVPAAAKPLDAAPELACLELGDWYGGLAQSALAGAKRRLYIRAQGYYERFLELHTPEDLQRTRASLALKKVQEALAKLGAEGWIDLLALVDPAKATVAGKWERKGSTLAIVSPAHFGRIMIPVDPNGGYETHIKFVRTSGDNAVGVILPVGSTAINLQLSAFGGTVGGLEMIRGKGNRYNETAVKPSVLQNGREHHIHVKVLLERAQARITVALDGKPFTQWRGPQSALSQWQDWGVPNRRCLGLGASGSTVVFRSARLKMLSGHAKLLQKQGAATAGR